MKTKIPLTMRKLLIEVLLGLGPVMVRSQSFTPSLPESFGVNKLSTVENLSTGVLNVNLPIESRIIPVSLHYATTGIRIGQQSSHVGTGWNISIGSYITREKRGISDDKEYGFIGNTKSSHKIHKYGGWVDGWSRDEYRSFIGAGDTPYDTEPDIFRYNIGGVSGAFIFSESGKVVKLTKDNLKIIPIKNALKIIQHFEVIDTQGNIYYFANDNVSKSVIRQTDNTLVSSDVVKWSVSYIELYTDGSRISFEYDEITSTRTKKHRFAMLNSDKTVRGIYQNTYNIENTEQFLSSVYYKGDKIEIEYSNRADDSSFKLISKITYGDWNTSTIYNFNYVYQGSSQRPMLFYVEKERDTESVILYQFDYYGMDPNEPSLPDYESSSVDHWGFYNLNEQDLLYSNSDPGKNSPDRTPNLSRARANTLKRVIYPAGGYEEYEYELNSYYTGSTNTYCGGLRIKRLHKKENGGSEYRIKEYSYFYGSKTGDLYAVPVYESGYQYDGSYYIREETPVNVIYDFNNNHIQYPYVQVTNLGQGYEEYFFHDYAEEKAFLGDTDDMYKWTSLYTVTAMSFSSDNSLPEPYAKNYYGTYAGILKEKVLRNSGYQIVSKEIYTYSKVSSGSTTYGLKTDIRSGVQDGNNTYHLAIFRFNPKYVLLDRIESQLYDDAGHSSKLITYTDFEYDDTYLQANRKISYASGATEAEKLSEETEFLYEAPGTLQNYEEHNLQTLSTKLTRKKGSKVLSVSENSYENNSETDKVQLHQIKGYMGSDNLISQSEVLFDPNNQKPAGAVDLITGVGQVSITSDIDNLLLATVSNADITEVAYTGFEDQYAGLWDFDIKSQCEILREECFKNCEKHCYSECYGEYPNCSTFVNDSYSYMGRYSFVLSYQDIVKNNLPSGWYLLSYWQRGANLSFTGISTNTMVQSRMEGEWTLEERKILVTSGGFTISGSGLIDELKLRPLDATMQSFNYDKMNNLVSETDDNNNSIYYDHDVFGRPVTVKDNDKNIIRHNDFHIANHLLAPDAADFSPAAGNKEVYIHTKGSWDISESTGWIWVSPSSGTGPAKVTLNASQNTGSDRSYTVAVIPTGGGLQNNILVSQEGPYISSQNTVTIYDYDEATVTVNANVDWTATKPSDCSCPWLQFGVQAVDPTKLNIGIIYDPDDPVTGTARWGQIKLSGGGATFTINVKNLKGN